MFRHSFCISEPITLQHSLDFIECRTSTGVSDQVLQSLDKLVLKFHLQTMIYCTASVLSFDIRILFRDQALFISYTILASAGIIFAICCMLFNIIFRKRKWANTSLVPRPSCPSIVTCSTNMGEGLVKLSDVVTYLDVWRSGTFPEKQQVS